MPIETRQRLEMHAAEAGKPLNDYLLDLLHRINEAPLPAAFRKARTERERN